MKALVLDGEKKLVVTEKEMPNIDGKKVVIKVSAAGICGSDLHIWKSPQESQKGLVMGHEFSGKVIDPGSLKDTLSVGDRVTALPLNPCGNCQPCRKGNINYCPNVWTESIGLDVRTPGAMAEYTAVRPDMVRIIPDTINDIDAAMIEPAAVALHAVNLADVRIGDKVLILGTGIIGLLSALMARLAGASYIAITGRNMARNKEAIDMGDGDDVFSSRDTDLLNKLISASKGGFDKVIDTVVSQDTVGTGLTAVVNGGKLILVGVNYNPFPILSALIVGRELNIMGSIAYTSEEFDDCISLLDQGKISLEKYASQPIKLEGGQEAFERLTSGVNPDVKIILIP